MARIHVGGQTLIVRNTLCSFIFLLVFLMAASYYYVFFLIKTVDQPKEDSKRVERLRNEMKPRAPVTQIRNKHLKQVVYKMAMQKCNYTTSELDEKVTEFLNSANHQMRPSDKVYRLNVTLSDKISVNRHINDSRHSICKIFKYSMTKLPNASVVVPFHDESLSMLLRTVHSVLNRSPDALLVEIILVDDASKHKYLKEDLEEYIKLLPKVKIIRNEQRLGAIKTKNIGYKAAQGQIVVFLDAHVEVNVGWLEPLCDEIRNHPNSIVQPVMDGITSTNLEYYSLNNLYKGAFSWDLRYAWMKLSEQEESRTIDTGYPFFSPILIGNAMAVDKVFFEKIGLFDEGMKIWGGDNIELSFRTWQCHGQIRTVVCSRVGHMFKNFHFSFEGDEDIIVQKNLMRAADVWMDSSSRFFYASTRAYEHNRVNFTEEENLSMMTQKNLRTQLKCKSFDWYLHSVIPEFNLPNTGDIFYGEIRNSATKACFEMMDDYRLGMTYECFEHNVIPTNSFAVNNQGHLTHEGRCLNIDEDNPVLQLGECPPIDIPLHAKVIWSFRMIGNLVGQIKATYSDNDKQVTRCVSQITYLMPDNSSYQMPMLSDCSESNKYQMWSFKYLLRYDLVPMHLN